MSATCRFCPCLLLPLFAGLGFLSGCGQPTPPATEPVAPIELKLITSPELEKVVQAQQGKLVVVDFWATWCTPCKRDFPRLVELHQRFHKNGVVCLSVSVDEEPDREDALTFLQEKQSPCVNFLLNEDATVWQEHWHIKGVPVVLIYGRDGKLIQKFDKDDPDNQFTYDDVVTRVEQLVAESN